jgi:hypothetical protein
LTREYTRVQQDTIQKIYIERIIIIITKFKIKSDWRNIINSCFPFIFISFISKVICIGGRSDTRVTSLHFLYLSWTKRTTRESTIQSIRLLLKPIATLWKLCKYSIACREREHDKQIEYNSKENFCVQIFINQAINQTASWY